MCAIIMEVVQSFFKNLEVKCHVPTLALYRHGYMEGKGPVTPTEKIFHSDLKFLWNEREKIYLNIFLLHNIFEIQFEPRFQPKFHVLQQIDAQNRFCLC